MYRLEWVTVKELESVYTVSATAGKHIQIENNWPIADNPLFPEGYSRYTRAVTTEQTTNSITFLAPGHWPASRVETVSYTHLPPAASARKK